MGIPGLTSPHTTCQFPAALGWPEPAGAPHPLIFDEEPGFERAAVLRPGYGGPSGVWVIERHRGLVKRDKTGRPKDILKTNSDIV